MKNLIQASRDVLTEAKNDNIIFALFHASDDIGWWADLKRDSWKLQFITAAEFPKGSKITKEHQQTLYSLAKLTSGEDQAYTTIKEVSVADLKNILSFNQAAMKRSETKFKNRIKQIQDSIKRVS
jgi:hypothetical protein